MDPWITVDELAVWARREIEPTDPFALKVVEGATIAVSSATGYHETEHEFTPVTAPDRLKVITALVAKRAYLNPDQIRTEGSVGPLGGDTYAEAFAAGLTLTEEEQAEIAQVARRAITGRKGAGLSVLTFNVRHNPKGSGAGTYLPDSSGSDWMIPMGD